MINRENEHYKSYTETKRRMFRIVTVFLVISSIIFIIPNLSNDLDDYTKSVEFFESSKFNTIKREKGFTTLEDVELVITMQNGRKWTFTEQYDKYWEELGNPKNVGKKFTIYTKGFVDTNPSQVEIENEIVYNLQTSMPSKYLLLLLTAIFVVISVKDYRKQKTLKVM
ncbi:hypothetical protein KIH23_10050 [Flavobacterium sp. CYK-55]|uniref:hypothetical protein n=1 Tax=Flavobacterium sp. CYK-55 TaxID=2835529 RepID=UPI001BD0633B|nr:hypothetical protein [Flavobacterium sp. CYK-55]MBS7787639.1 hypothetical protein [Flavobacterium sp. CYK-55]